MITCIHCLWNVLSRLPFSFHLHVQKLSSLHELHQSVLTSAASSVQGRLQAGDQISFVLPASGNTCVAGCVHLPAGTKAGDSISLKEGGVILNSVCLSEHHLDTVGVLSSLASLDL